VAAAEFKKQTGDQELEFAKRWLEFYCPRKPCRDEPGIAETKPSGK
jgi:hypothetical protein